MSRYKTLWFLVRSGVYFSVGEECWTTLFTFWSKFEEEVGTCRTRWRGSSL